MAITWEQRMAAMRREHLGIIHSADREIIGIYQRAAEEMARKAGQSNSGSLTERWVTDYKRSLDDNIAQLRQDIYGSVRKSAAASAQLPAEATRDWMTRAMQAAGGGLDKSFTATLSRAPTDALRAMLDGHMYRDGVTLSRRVWTETGRLKFGIEEALTQGLAQQKSLKEISRDLEQYLDPDFQGGAMDMRRIFPRMGDPALPGQPIPKSYQIEYNCQRLARTAVNHAYWGANKAAAKANPLCAGMKWILSADHFARQVAKWGEDVCDEYAAHDEKLGKGVYPIDRLPMPHPQCLCRQEQVVPTLDEATDRLNAWLAGGSDPALDQGFARAQKAAGLDKPAALKKPAALDKPAKTATIEAQGQKMPTSTNPLEKGIRSLEKNIDIHNEKIETISKQLTDFAGDELREAEGNIHHWEAEIRAFQDQIERKRREIERRQNNGVGSQGNEPR